jgi:ribonucleoside-diphosphate reductase alpha chain
MGKTHRRNHRRRRQGHFQTGKRRSAQILVLLATKVVVSKYFYGEQNTGERETSVRQLIHRVCRTIADWGVRDGYFDKAKGEIFYDELAWLMRQSIRRLQFAGLVQRRPLINTTSARSPPAAIGFTIARPAPSAPAPNTNIPRAAPASSNRSMTTWKASCTWPTARRCFSNTAPAPAPISARFVPAARNSAAAGRPSGPLSFLKVYDQVANVVKSGGKTRRAAKMNTLRDWHGDIEEFIDAKQKEEKKAWALIEQGYDGSYNGDAYGSVMYQNENLSVRVSDEFMQAALDGKEWWTRRDGWQTAAKEGRRHAPE